VSPCRPGARSDVCFFVALISIIIATGGTLLPARVLALNYRKRIDDQWRCSPQTFGVPPHRELENVWSPDRLRMAASCIVITGTVEHVYKERDADYHIVVKPDLPYRTLLAKKNRGGFVVEVVPADQPGCFKGEKARPDKRRRSFGTCTGRAVYIPPVGMHVSVSGAYVLDIDHAWMEIHPAWSIQPLP